MADQSIFDPVEIARRNAGMQAAAAATGKPSALSPLSQGGTVVGTAGPHITPGGALKVPNPAVSFAPHQDNFDYGDYLDDADYDLSKPSALNGSQRRNPRASYGSSVASDEDEDSGDRDWLQSQSYSGDSLRRQEALMTNVNEGLTALANSFAGQTRLLKEQMTAIKKLSAQVEEAQRVMHRLLEAVDKQESRLIALEKKWTLPPFRE